MHSKTYDKTYRIHGAVIRKRGTSYQVEVNHAGKRTRTTFKTKDAAIAHAGRMRGEVEDSGVDAMNLSLDQRRDALRAFKRLAGRATLGDVADFWVRHHADQGDVVKVGSLLTTYLESRTRLNRRPATMQELNSKLVRALDPFKEMAVQLVSASDLEGWIKNQDFSPISHNKYRRLLQAFFNYAEKRGLLVRNPVNGISTARVDKGPPKFYSTEHVEQILRTAEALWPETCAGLAVGFFAGLRPSELSQLTWAKVDLRRSQITCDGDKSKVRHHRFVEISPNLIAWLDAYKADVGQVMPKDMTFIRRRLAIWKQVAIPRWIPDGLRHTYATMHVAKHQDANRTAVQMATSTNVLYKNYRGLVAPEEAERFWQILPTKELAQRTKEPCTG